MKIAAIVNLETAFKFLSEGIEKGTTWNWWETLKVDSDAPDSELLSVEIDVPDIGKRRGFIIRWNGAKKGVYFREDIPPESIRLRRGLTGSYLEEGE